MAKSKNNVKAVLKDTADAIRAKKDSEELIEPRDFADEIASIETGITPEGTLEINENGEHDVTYYAAVDVNLGPSDIGLDSRYIGAGTGVYSYSGSGNFYSYDFGDFDIDPVQEVNINSGELIKANGNLEFYEKSDATSSYTTLFNYQGYCNTPDNITEVQGGLIYYYKDLGFLDRSYITELGDLSQGIYTFYPGGSGGEAFMNPLDLEKDNLYYYDDQGEFSFPEPGTLATELGLMDGHVYFSAGSGTFNDLNFEDGAFYYYIGGSDTVEYNLGSCCLYICNSDFSLTGGVDLPSGEGSYVELSDKSENNYIVFRSGYSLDIEENGESIDVSGYDRINVNVPDSRVEVNDKYFSINCSNCEDFPGGLCYCLGSIGHIDGTFIELEEYSAYIYNSGEDFDKIIPPESGEKTTVEIASENYDLFKADEAVIPTGNLEINEEGENIDVAQYATVSVSVPDPEAQIDANGFSIGCSNDGDIVEGLYVCMGSLGYINASSVDVDEGSYYYYDGGDAFTSLSIEPGNTYLLGSTSPDEFIQVNEGLNYIAFNYAAPVSLTTGSTYTYTGNGEFEAYEAPEIPESDGAYAYVNGEFTEIEGFPDTVGEPNLGFYMYRPDDTVHYKGSLEELYLPDGPAIYNGAGSSGIDTTPFNSEYVYVYNNYDLNYWSLPDSGEKTTISTDYGNYDIFNEDEALIPTGNFEILQNGTNIDIAQYATVTVNVSGGGTDALDELMQESF